jgi:acyl-CoA thioester hydrolase
VTSIPTYEQVTALPTVHEHVVGPEHLDENRHMNVQHYFTFAGGALWHRHRTDLGMPDAYITERGMTTFTAEQHLRYLGESVEGDRLGVAVVLVDHGPRSLHAAALLVNHTRRQLAFVMEAVEVHVDFGTRRPVPFPDDVAARLAAAVEGDRVDWDLPLSGALGVRR